MSINENITTNELLKQEHEAKQDEKYATSQVTQTQNRLKEALSEGAKISAIKKAFAQEEWDKGQVEKERDENLVAYLEEREKRLHAEAENRIIRQQLKEESTEKLRAMEYQRQQRDEQFTQSETDKELEQLSRKRFNDLLESRKGFKLNK